MDVIILKVIGYTSTDDWITLMNYSVSTMQELSFLENCVERTKNNLENPSKHLPIVFLLLFDSSCYSILKKMMLWGALEAVRQRHLQGARALIESSNQCFRG
jgi:hypothetical protein